jgi:hypothetical protein
MYNPLSLLSVQLLTAMTKSPKLFIREYYERGYANETYKSTQPFLLTWYDKQNEVEKSRALFHLQQLPTNAKPCIYDSENPVDYTKLLIAASQPKGFAIYINILPQKWLPPAFLTKCIHLYMLQKFTNWQYKKYPKLQVCLIDKYGKLYVQLSWKNNKAEVLLQIIENCTVCVTI